MRAWLRISLSLAGVVCALAVAYDQRFALAGRWFLPQDGVRAADNRVCADPEAAIAMSDNVVLRADIYRPCGQATAATILVRIPFSRGLKNEIGAGSIAHFWASRGYNVVVQGTRGRYKSGGAFYPLRHEREDGLATLVWLKRQPWFDGRLGMWGGSAFGHTIWSVADQPNSGPIAFHLQIVSTSFQGMLHQGGAFALESALYWAVRSHGASDIWPDQAQLDRGFNGWPLIEADNRAVGNVPFFDDWLLNPLPGDYWRRIDGEDRARNLKGPVLLLGGWQDPFLPTMLRDFMTIRRDAAPAVAAGSRLVIGPWTHADAIRFPDGTTAGDYRPASVGPSLPWFDHHLRGQPEDATLAAPVRIFVLGEKKWRDEREWPLERAVSTAFYLRQASAGREHGLLATAVDQQQSISFVYDPRNPAPTRGGAMLGDRAGIHQQNDIEQREDVLVFTGEPLSADLEVTGPIEAELFVATTAPNTDFTVKLVDVHPDGRSFNVTDGILRRDFPIEARAGGATTIRVELNPTSMLFRKGHRLRVHVSSSNYPRFDRNPNTGRDIARETAPVSATQTLFLGAATPSRIILPVVPR